LKAGGVFLEVCNIIQPIAVLSIGAKLMRQSKYRWALYWLRRFVVQALADFDSS
jgi:hypothetical protein